MGSAPNAFRRFYTFLARMGLVIHDEPLKVISAEGREWGPAVGGLALSIQNIASFDPVTAVIINRGDTTQTLHIPGWLFYFDYEVATTDGKPVELSSFGRQLLRPERRTEKLEITLAPGAHAATEIPIGSLFGLNSRTCYRIRLRAGDLVSNEIAVGERGRRQ